MPSLEAEILRNFKHEVRNFGATSALDSTWTAFPDTRISAGTRSCGSVHAHHAGKTIAVRTSLAEKCSSSRAVQAVWGE
jgi:hypothetical protein